MINNNPATTVTVALVFVLLAATIAVMGASSVGRISERWADVAMGVIIPVLLLADVVVMGVTA